MTIRSDYKSSLLGLCTSILHWFANAFMRFRSHEDQSSKISTQEELLVTLWKEIKTMDAVCQKFTIVAEIMPEDDGWDGNSD